MTSCRLSSLQRICGKWNMGALALGHPNPSQFGATLSPIAASSSGELRLKRNQKGKVDINLAQKIAGGMIIASYGLAAINRQIGGDDDDGIAYFDKIPHSIRERNLNVMNLSLIHI